MSRPHTPRPEVLVAVDFGPGAAGITPDVDVLVARLERAAPGSVINVDTTTRPHWRTGDPQTVHRITFDSALLRNTEAHGIGHRAAFVVHVEPTEAQQRGNPR